MDSQQENEDLSPTPKNRILPTVSLEEDLTSDETTAPANTLISAWEDLEQRTS